MTSPFRDQVQRDIGNVFLNQDELGKTVRWNGTDIVTVEDANQPLLIQYAQGTDSNVRRLVFSDEAFGTLPRVYEEVDIDGESWTVRDIRNPPGFLLVTLEQRTG